jgi:ferric-dicitrate binding protein FerR (iron transport regulator)
VSLQYPHRFGEERRVRLVGEAFFEVEEHSTPFIVQTFNAEVTVLGTTFNVKAWPTSLDPATTVTLESGRVALNVLDRPDEAVQMDPGQTRRIR